MVTFSPKSIGACGGYAGSLRPAMRSKWGFDADASIRLVFLSFCFLTFVSSPFEKKGVREMFPSCFSVLGRWSRNRRYIPLRLVRIREGATGVSRRHGLIWFSTMPGWGPYVDITWAT